MSQRRKIIPKSLDTIRQQCRRQRLKLNTSTLPQGGKTIFVSGGGANVAFNIESGWMGGKTPAGIEFDSDGWQHVDKPWFQALLDFFCIEPGHLVGRRKATT